MRYHNITKDDMLNGDGLRVVLWVSGCSHGCRECHNPVTWEIEGGLPFDDEAKAEVFKELSMDYTAGITMSGGDPLHPLNREDMGILMEEIKRKFPDKTIWLYTGYDWDDIKELSCIRWVDVLVDGRFIAEQADKKLKWRGSGNQRIIDVKKSLMAGEVAKYSKNH